jgi:hypothetical protein
LVSVVTETAIWQDNYRVVSFLNLLAGRLPKYQYFPLGTRISTSARRLTDYLRIRALLLNNKKTAYIVCACCLLPLVVSVSFGQEQETVEEQDDVISMITVVGRRVANEHPASTYDSAATLLRYDPQLDLQSRGLAEGQADISVRGGLFENTGFKVGAITLFDPQTGHYFADMPVDPGAISTPEVLTGIDNSIHGFNSAIATINYELTELTTYRELTLGVGSDDLFLGRLRAGHLLRDSGDSVTGVEFSYSGSQGDGTLPNGDHDFERFFARVQHRNADNQTDALIAYQDKFYGWPGAYTGFSTLAETDHTKTKLLVVNHHRSHSDDSWWELGAIYRQLDDDYDFDRTNTESGAPGSFDHETKAYAVGIQGGLRLGAWQWRYGGQITADELVRSTDLTNGQFNSRSYTTLSVVPSRSWTTDSGNRVTLRLGATADMSNRDSNALLPLIGWSIEKVGANATKTYQIEYSSSSQLPGYTVLNSRESGLFGGNPDLGRERANSLSFTMRRQTRVSKSTATLFVREDKSLVDWTFLNRARFARQANPVDLDVVGIELLWARQWPNAYWTTGYTYLDKDADYGTASVDASFYALNFAKHRFTTGLIYQPTDRLEVRLDGELRKQEANVLRSDDDEAFIASASVGWRLGTAGRLGLDLVIDNITNDNFEEFPGTPAARRQISLQSRFSW